MRIGLFNSNPAWGGGERWFFDAGEALAERGHAVVRIGRLGTPLHDRWGASTPTAAALPALCTGAEGLEVLVCNSGREVRQALRALPRGSRTRLVLRRGLDRPLRNNWIRRRSWRRLTAILVNSEATGRTVRRSLPWFPGDRIRRIYNPVAAAGPASAHLPQPPIRLLVVGRLVAQKGIDLLLDAMALEGRADGWTLRVAGGGRLRDELEGRAAGLGLDERVVFLGHVREVWQEYTSADVVVVPSRYEGFCFVAAEAALAGRPVVGTRVSSLPEVVEDGRTGLLVSPEDPAALGRAIRTLVDDPERARAMGLAGRSRAERLFAPDAIYGELESFLAEVAEWCPVSARGSESSGSD